VYGDPKSALLGKVLPMQIAGDKDAPLQQRVSVSWEAVDVRKDRADE
jgi:hypothetical protein